MGTAEVRGSRGENQLDWGHSSLVHIVSNAVKAHPGAMREFFGILSCAEQEVLGQDKYRLLKAIDAMTFHLTTSSYADRVVLLQDELANRQIAVAKGLGCHTVYPRLGSRVIYEPKYDP